MFKRWWVKTKYLFYKFFGKYYIATKCGHKTKKVEKVDVFGEIFFLLVYKTYYCADCLAKMSIRCAWCGQSIKVGDAITLNTPIHKSFKIHDYAVKYSEDPLLLVGCLRWECADGGLDRAGFWEIPGKVARVLSPLEMMMATDDCVIVNNLTDPNRAIPYPNEENHL